MSNSELLYNLEKDRDFYQMAFMEAQKYSAELEAEIVALEAVIRQWEVLATADDAKSALGALLKGGEA